MEYSEEDEAERNTWKYGLFNPKLLSQWSLYYSMATCPTFIIAYIVVLAFGPSETCFFTLFIIAAGIFVANILILLLCILQLFFTNLPFFAFLFTKDIMHFYKRIYSFPVAILFMYCAVWFIFANSRFYSEYNVCASRDTEVWILVFLWLLSGYFIGTVFIAYWIYALVIVKKPPSLRLLQDEQDQVDS